MWQPATQQTKEVRQPTSRMCYNEATINVYGRKLKLFDKFTYPLFPEQLLYTLITRSLPKLGIPVLHYEDFVNMSVI